MAKEKQKEELEQEEFGMEFNLEELELKEEKEQKKEQINNKEKK
ncbi:hypothetical protein [Lysinibacillus xylanilyticus]|nr:hypothetical protein [Lysinibacillus xylanilyticus]